MLFLSVSLSALIQAFSNYFVGIWSPHFSFFAIYLLAFLLFAARLVIYRQGNVFLHKPVIELPVILIGQVLAPFLYFKGVFLTDIVVQNAIYLIYPIAIIIFTNKISWSRETRTTIVLSIATIITSIGFALYALKANSSESSTEGILWLFCSATLLIIHKLLQQWIVNSNGEVNTNAWSLYGLGSSALLGFFIITYEGDAFDQIYSINLTENGLLTAAGLLVTAFSLQLLQPIRNNLVNKKKTAELFLWSLFIAPLAIAISNVISLFDHRVIFDSRIFGLYGITFALLFALMGRWKVIPIIIATYISGHIFTSSLPINISLWNTDYIKILYSEEKRFSAVVKKDGKTWVIKNKKDYTLKEFITIEAPTGYFKLARDSSGKNFKLYIKDYIGTDNSSIVYDMATYNKYIMKPISHEMIERLLSFQRIAGKYSWLAEFKIIMDDKKQPYVLTDYIYGQTLEQYWGMHRPDYKEQAVSVKILDHLKQIAQMQKLLVDEGWVNRDIHSRNIMVTGGRLVMIDYDMIYRLDVDSIEAYSIDTNGFDHPLFDIYRLLFPKVNSINEKFSFKDHQYINFNKDNLFINKWLISIGRRVQDNTYFRRTCIRDSKSTKDALHLLQLDIDLMLLGKLPADNKIKKPSLLDVDGCTLLHSFYNHHGANTFTIFTMPSGEFESNIIYLNQNFRNEDLLFGFNKTNAYSMQKNDNYAYSLISHSDVSVDKELLLKFLRSAIDEDAVLVK